TALDAIAEQSRQRAEEIAQGGGAMDPIAWHAANQLFGQEGYAFRPEFLALMRHGYAAPLQPLDFRADVEGSRSTINSWVEDETHAKIRNLIPRGGIKHDTRLVLVNALYLKAPWAEPFKKEHTQPEPFHIAGATPRDVPTMQMTHRLYYARESGRTVVA